MKRKYTSIIHLLSASVMLLLGFVVSVTGQTPGTFNYQSVLFIPSTL